MRCIKILAKQVFFTFPFFWLSNCLVPPILFFDSKHPALESTRWLLWKIPKLIKKASMSNIMIAKFNPYDTNAPFLYPLKTSENLRFFWKSQKTRGFQRTRGFLMFSRGIKMEHWCRMGFFFYINMIYMWNINEQKNRRSPGIIILTECLGLN